MGQQWELFSHKADMGIRGKGATFEEAFEQAGLGLISVLTDPAQITSKLSIHLTCSASTMDTLFYDWVNELIYNMAIHHLIFNKFHVKISHETSGQLTLDGEAWGEKVNEKKHKIAVEVKGATFTELKTEVTPNGDYIVQCIVDV